MNTAISKEDALAAIELAGDDNHGHLSTVTRQRYSTANALAMADRASRFTVGKSLGVPTITVINMTTGCITFYIPKFSEMFALA
jgi:hypothetical protein